MLDIQVNNPCYIKGDNLSVLWSKTVPDSTLKRGMNGELDILI